MAEELRRKALELELKKRFGEAAECWESCGQLEKAIANYHRAGLIKRAVDVALRNGLKSRAAELYLKADIPEKAAELYRQLRDFGNAGRAYRKAGMLSEAAAMFEASGEFREAAQLFESANDFVRAGELYDKGGDLASSARAYELAIDTRAVDRLGGKKDLSRVAEVLARVRNFEKAAEIYIQTQEVSEAVLLFVRMGEVERAAHLLANCQGDVGFEVLARIEPAEAKALEFARMFYLARDYGKAARVFESCKEYAKAGFLYEKQQDYHQAGEMHALAGDASRAAESFERAGSYRDAGDYYARAGDLARAAGAYEAAGDYFQAGRLLCDIERHDRAIELLQKVSRSDPRYLDAAALVAELLRRKGCLDLAIDRYRHILAGAKCDGHTVGLHYNLARVMLDKEEYGEAEQLLVEVIRFQVDYEDAARLLERARERRAAPAGGPGPHAPPPGTPVPAGPVAPSPAVTGQLRGPALVGRMNGFDVLASTELFQDLSLGEMRRFWEICEVRSAAQGDVILPEGVPGAGLYVVWKGCVNVEKGGEILVQLHPGEFFGEMSLVDERAMTSASIRAAAGEVVLFFLARDAFRKLMGANDHTALKISQVFVSTLCERLRKASESLAALLQRSG